MQPFKTSSISVIEWTYIITYILAYMNKSHIIQYAHVYEEVI